MRSSIVENMQLNKRSNQIEGKNDDFCNDKYKSRHAIYEGVKKWQSP